MFILGLGNYPFNRQPRGADVAGQSLLEDTMTLKIMTATARQGFTLGKLLKPLLFLCRFYMTEMRKPVVNSFLFKLRTRQLNMHHLINIPGLKESPSQQAWRASGRHISTPDAFKCLLKVFKKRGGHSLHFLWQLDHCHQIPLLYNRHRTWKITHNS